MIQPSNAIFLHLFFVFEATFQYNYLVYWLLMWTFKTLCFAYCNVCLFSCKLIDATLKNYLYIDYWCNQSKLFSFILVIDIPFKKILALLNIDTPFNTIFSHIEYWLIYYKLISCLLIYWCEHSRLFLFCILHCMSIFLHIDHWCNHLKLFVFYILMQPKVNFLAYWLLSETSPYYFLAFFLYFDVTIPNYFLAYWILIDHLIQFSCILIIDEFKTISSILNIGANIFKAIFLHIDCWCEHSRLFCFAYGNVCPFSCKLNIGANIFKTIWLLIQLF